MYTKLIVATAHPDYGGRIDESRSDRRVKRTQPEGITDGHQARERGIENQGGGIFYVRGTICRRSTVSIDVVDFGS